MTNVLESTSNRVIEKLHKENLTCFDCLKPKSTSCINMTIGCFVCLSCSGILREFNKFQLKSITPISKKSELDDTESTHPSLPKRRKAVNDVIGNKSNDLELVRKTVAGISCGMLTTG